MGPPQLPPGRIFDNLVTSADAVPNYNGKVLYASTIGHYGRIANGIAPGRIWQAQNGVAAFLVFSQAQALGCSLLAAGILFGKWHHSQLASV